MSLTAMVFRISNCCGVASAVTTVAAPARGPSAPAQPFGDLGGGVVVGDADGVADAVEGEAAEAVGEQPAPAPDECLDRGLVGPSWNPRKGVEHRVGHRVGCAAECAEETQNRARVDPGRKRVDGELQQRRAGDAVAVGPVRFDSSGGDQLIEVRGHQRGKQLGELSERGGGARFVDVHELVGLEAEHVGECCSVAPRREEIADTGERVPPVLEAVDELEATEVAGVVAPDAAFPPRWVEQAHRLVFADRAHRRPALTGELVDAPCRGGGRRVQGPHSIDNTSKYRYGRHRDNRC